MVTRAVSEPYSLSSEQKKFFSRSNQQTTQVLPVLTDSTCSILDSMRLVDCQQSHSRKC
jgi:hypothetical protein